MLQWMGGSKRKVTTSRKSTYKRQKQYFEQRKRQLQQQAAGLESYSDVKGSHTLQCGNSRSLDILSLENISTLAHKDKTSCINELQSEKLQEEAELKAPIREATDTPEHNNFTLNHQDASTSPVILTNEGIAVDQPEMNGERTPSSYITEDEYTEKVSVCRPDRNEDIDGNHEKLDSLKLSPMHQISVIDLLGDDGGANNNEENSVHAQEAHVAFSVAGLGKVEIGTPVHSPKVPSRYFPNCSTPPKKARRQPIIAKHLDFDFHDLGSEVDIGFSPYDSSIDQPFCSRDMMDIVGSPNQMFSSFRRPSPYNWNVCDSLGVLGNDELVCDVQDSSRDIWNDPSFLDDSIDDLGEYDAFCKNRVHHRDIGFDPDFHCKDTWKQDWDPHMKRFPSNRTSTFDVKDSAVPHPKHRTAGDIPGVVFSDKFWCSSTDIGDDVKDSVNHFVREGTTESLSLLSEESCSSTAVRGDATKRS